MPNNDGMPHQPISPSFFHNQPILTKNPANSGHFTLRPTNQPANSSPGQLPKSQLLNEKAKTNDPVLRVWAVCLLGKCRIFLVWWVVDAGFARLRRGCIGGIVYLGVWALILGQMAGVFGGVLGGGCQCGWRFGRFWLKIGWLTWGGVPGWCDFGK